MAPSDASRSASNLFAGSASGIADGAAALLLASEEAAARHGLKPLVRVVDWAVSGVAPSEMGIGPSPAIRKLLSKTGISLGSIDLIEVNEAFAAQFLAVEKDLGLDR
jgi:acetyl-CoA acetyltransferase